MFLLQHHWAIVWVFLIFVSSIQSCSVLSFEIRFLYWVFPHSLWMRKIWLQIWVFLPFLYLWPFWPCPLDAQVPLWEAGRPAAYWELMLHCTKLEVTNTVPEEIFHSSNSLLLQVPLFNASPHFHESGLFHWAPHFHWVASLLATLVARNNNSKIHSPWFQDYPFQNLYD